jgi:hypothetical protein
MNISAQTLELLSEATGFSRDSIRSSISEICSALGDRLSAMQQRVSGIMANAQMRGGGAAGVDDVVSYTDASLTAADKARIFKALGLGFVGGLLMASAAGSIVVLLVGLALLIASGMMLMRFLKIILQKLTDALDLF